eukprot:CAMPEP_0169113806 /NCGR_PEP_ID=MMETSP1015-20121227/28406_1 /TAXON_ID=342587 /ORGANISM="Karlodinium micrum, Strain CCMP2283" /LENGTH=204 /DNA_ID=CAMNT_0009176017 /DNA_START=60 /DNA_END=674 /DNA_ORIENTATION=+
MSAADVVGWYDLEWSGGSFPVCFRPVGVFFCPKFQAQAKWTIEGDIIKIDWQKFGQYELKFDASSKTMEGNAIPKSDKEANWRKAKNFRPLSDVEKLILGDGAGSRWEFSWKDGSFPVEFKADGYNHFKCSDFPAHAHWTLEGSEIKINWGEYGKYKLAIDAEAKTMSGGEDGGDESKDTWWRKAAFSENLINSATLEACDHHH